MKCFSISTFSCSLLAFAAAGCQSNAGEIGFGGAKERSSGALTELRSCQQVEDAVRGAALRAMSDLLEDRLQQDLDALSKGQCWSYAPDGFGCPLCFGGPSVSSSAGGAPKQVSKTNNQVAGVDEADFVKNDQNHIYAIAGQRLSIIQAWPPEEARVVSTVDFAEQPKRMFVEGDRLLLFSSVPKSAEERSEYRPWWTRRSTECSYGYDCDFTGDGHGTRLTLFDIGDRSAPKQLRTIDTSATFISARLIGTAVHTVLYQEPELLRKLDMSPSEVAMGLCTGKRVETSGGTPYEIPVPAPEDPARVGAAYARLKERNLEAIRSAPIEQLIGTMRDDLGSDSSTDPLHACEGFYDSPLADGVAFLSLMSFDLGSDQPVQTSTIVSRPGASYAAGDAYYISVRQEPTGGLWFQDLNAEPEASTIHKFDLAGATNRYAASGLVKGRVLNQFAMDQASEHLRIATTSGHLPSPDVHSTLSALRQTGSRLEVVGQVDHIAPAEDIRSVRFLGDRAYVVTFKKTDPLFVFDLSHPTDLRTLGELKIPGFSTYMHPLDDDHLMSIGYDASDQGDFAWFTGLMLQIFDVTDAANPTLTHKEVIGTRGSSSEAATNHLAFNYFAPKNTLALPITVCEGGDVNGGYGTEMTFSGVMFYTVDAEGGFSLAGRSEHPYSSASSNPANACSNWWTDSNSVVKRTVFMDDYAYSISDVRLKVNDIRDPARDITVVPLK